MILYPSLALIQKFPGSENIPELNPKTWYFLYFVDTFLYIVDMSVKRQNCFKYDTVSEL